jgi:Ankyrin repeats (3 copies)
VLLCWYYCSDRTGAISKAALRCQHAHYTLLRRDTQRTRFWAAVAASNTSSIHIPHYCSSCTTGHLEVLQYLASTAAVTGAVCTTAAIDFAAGQGHLAVLQWLHQRGCSASTNAMDSACANGQLQTLRYLHKHRREGCSQDAIVLAAAAGHLSTVQWLVAHYEVSTADGAAAAQHSGHIDVYAYLQGLSGSWKAVTAASSITAAVANTNASASSVESAFDHSAAPAAAVVAPMQRVAVAFKDLRVDTTRHTQHRYAVPVAAVSATAAATPALVAVALRQEEVLVQRKQQQQCEQCEQHEHVPLQSSRSALAVIAAAALLRRVPHFAAAVTAPSAQHHQQQQQTAATFA